MGLCILEGGKEEVGKGSENLKIRRLWKKWDLPILDPLSTA